MNEATKFVTPRPVRVSFPSLFTPRESENGGDPKFGITLLIPKSDTAMIAQINMAIEAARQAALAGPWKGVCPPNLATTFYDGDLPQPKSGEAWGPECAGHMLLRAGSPALYPPQVLDGSGQKLLDASKIYGGCYCYVSLNMFAYSVTGNKGISAGLNAVMFNMDGEQLGGGGVNAQADFAAFIPGGNGGMSQQEQGMFQQPQQQYQQPAPQQQYQAPQQQYQQPAPQQQYQAPQYQQPAPQYQQPAPQYQQPAPQQQAAPAANQWS